MPTRYSILTVLVFALAQAACAHAQTPRDISEFTRQRDLCDHLRGELPDPEESERLAEAVSAINRQCRGTDAALGALKHKYASSPSIKPLLDLYEPNIEAP